MKIEEKGECLCGVPYSISIFEYSRNQTFVLQKLNISTGTLNDCIKYNNYGLVQKNV